MDLEREPILALARSVRQKRTAREWSIDHLAARSGVSKGAVVAVENGTTNPSLSTITRLADALGVSITDVLGGETVERVQLYPHAEIAPLWQSEAGGKAMLILTVPGATPVELWEWTLGPNERYEGTAHPNGFIETLTVQRGVLELTVPNQTLTIPTGTTATFQADCDHVYAAGKDGVTFIMTVHLRGGR